MTGSIALPRPITVKLPGGVIVTVMSVSEAICLLNDQLPDRLRNVFAVKHARATLYAARDFGSPTNVRSAAKALRLAMQIHDLVV